VDFNEYQSKAVGTAIYKNNIAGLTYPVLGLAGEAGEVAEKYKKLLRDNNGVITDEFRIAVKKELGDVMWYVANVADELGISLDDVAISNLEKLYSRKERGVLQGSGDNR